MGRNESMKRGFLLLAPILLVPAAVSSASAGNEALYRRGTVALVEEQVFGGEYGPEEAVLFRVGGFDVDGDGNVYAPDMQLHCIKRFAPSGELVATIGAEGAGPGDLRRPMAIVVCPDGDLIVYEIGNRRVQRLTAEGEYVASALSYDIVQDFALGPGGELYASVYVLPQGMSDRSTYRVVRFTEAMDTSATLDEMTAVTSATVQHGNSYSLTSLPYPPGLEWGLLPNGRVVVGHGDTNEFRILDADGSVRRTVTVEGEPMRVEEEHRKEYWSRFMRDGRLDIDPEMKQAITFPDRLPYYSDISIDDEGFILLRWGEPVDGRVTFAVFDEKGDPVSRVTMPEIPSRALFSGGKVYALDRSREELPTITRYRME
jgi:hypothetical protein